MKMKFCLSAAILMSLLCWCARVDAVEIKGTVRSATATTATIATEGEFAPNIGDPVEVFFKLSGTDTEISVASGKVSTVKADVIEARIDKATGTLSKDQLARITSAKPQKRSAAATTQSPPAGSGEKQISATAGRNPSFAFVNMDNLFKQHPKTKSAEAKINEDKTAAKNEYDQRADEYKKLLDDVNGLNRQIEVAGSSEKTQLESDRDAKITMIKATERSILEFRYTREKALQDEALKLREEIVADITAHIKQLGEQTANVIFDVSGNSLNGVPLLVRYPQSADTTEPVISAIAGRQSSVFEFHPAISKSQAWI